MISKLFLITALSLPLMAAKNAHAAEINCNAVQLEHKELGAVLHPEVLGNLYSKAMLKIASMAVMENYETFEDFAKSVLQDTDAKSLTPLKNRGKKFSYWQKDHRISNADFSIVASLLTGRGAGKLDSDELAALNLVYLSNKNENKISFSEVIYKLISKGGNVVYVSVPQLQQIMGNYPTTCLQKAFPKNQATAIINKMSMNLMREIQDVSIENEEVRLGRSVLVKLPSLKISKKRYDENGVESLNIGHRLLSEVGGSFNSYRKSNATIHGVSNLETIKHFHKFYGLSEFAILNKGDKTLTVYDESSRVVKKISVEISSTDDRMNAGGAGIYFGLINSANAFYAKALSDKGMREVFKTRSPLRLGNGPLYILPQDTNEHKFRIKNKRLAFSGYQFYRKSRSFNYSIDTETTFRLEIKHNYKSKFVADYINALEKEKSRLMKILKVDNDDYNILAGFAIGVLSPESDFGKNWKYLLKEFLPGAVSLAKGNGLDTSKNSRGPTQLKAIPDEVMEHYGIDKTNLVNPENAAVATIAVSADFLKQLRNMGGNHKAIDEENIQNYLYYLYQGKRVQIKEALATPNDNLAIRKIMGVVNGLDFLEY